MHLISVTIIMTGMRSLLFIFSTLILSSCSLLKFSVTTGEHPLSSDQLLSRVLVRGFYGDFCYAIIECADSVILSTDDVLIEMNAIRLKKGATSACAVAVYNAVPDVAMVNTWAIVLRMRGLLSSNYGEHYFGEYAEYLSRVSSDLALKYDSIARQLLSPVNYIETKSLVVGYCNNNPMRDLLFLNSDLAVEYSAIASSEEYTSVGLLSEVIADMNDRMGGYGRQFVNDMSWSKDMLMLQLKSDSVGGDVKLYADSLQRMFTQTVSIFDSLPSYMGYGSEQVRIRILQINEGMQSAVEGMFLNLELRQAALEEFVDMQRESLFSDIDMVVQGAIGRVEQAIPNLVRRVVVWLVLLFVVLSFVPFLVGFMVGRRKNEKKS